MILRGLIVVVVVDVLGRVVVVTAAVAIVVDVDVVVVPPPPPDAMVVVVEVDAIVNEIAEEVAAPWEPFDAIDAVIVHVPALTKVTWPVEVPIVQTDVVELE